MKFERKPYVCTPPCDQFANYFPLKKKKKKKSERAQHTEIGTYTFYPQFWEETDTQSVTIFWSLSLRWTRGRARQGSEIHRDRLPSPPPTLFARDRRLQEK